MNVFGKLGKVINFSFLLFPDAGLKVKDVFDYVEEVKAFVKTEKGFTIMVDQQGYEYQVHSRNFADERIRWRCRLYRTSNYLGTNCTGGAWTLGNKITKFHKEHIHPSFVHRDDH